MTELTPADEARFWPKIHKTDACWLWTASLDKHGYGQFHLGNGPKKAHRVAFELAYGPIPKGLEPDHTCRNRACVNPAHIDLVTHRVNVLRGMATSAMHARKTHCPQGHPYDEENTLRRRSGHRVCRYCNRERNRQRSSGLGAGHHNAAKTHCPAGHPYDAENTYVLPSRPSARYCRACARARVDARRGSRPS